MTMLDHYVKVIKKRLGLILLISVVAGVVALVVAKQAEPQHQVHFSYIVSLASRDPGAVYRFDGFYALQATDLFTATLASWASTPETLVAAYREAGVELPSDDPRTLTRAVRAEKAAPQLVAVTVRDTEASEAQRLAQGLQRVMERNVARYNTEGVPDVTFQVVTTDPWSGVVRLSVPMIVAATFLFTFLIVLNGVILRESLRT